ncbi:MAG: serine kinase [Rhodobacterales bacterium]|nr:MAG: serine kinase [Rhodobacterales bacterium]
MSAPARETLHGTSVSVAGRAVLITGSSGAGKSALALELISRGGELISDDLTRVERRGEQLIALAPERMRGAIEARGFGILSVPFAAQAELVCVFDLNEQEADRLPEPAEVTILGLPLRKFARPPGPHFPAALQLFLQKGFYPDGIS